MLPTSSPATPERGWTVALGPVQLTESVDFPLARRAGMLGNILPATSGRHLSGAVAQPAQGTLQAPGQHKGAVRAPMIPGYLSSLLRAPWGVLQ